MKQPLVAAALLLFFAISLDRAMGTSKAAEAPAASKSQATGSGDSPQSRADREAPDPNAEPSPEQAAKEAEARAKNRTAATRPSPNTRPAAPPGPRPIEQIRRVMVVSIDGLRPDLLLLADAPVARSLMKRGCYSMWAMTTPQ